MASSATPPKHVEQDGQKLSLTRSTAVRRRRKRTSPTPPRSFADIVGAAELGTQYYVQVVRRRPKYYLGQACDGLQKPICRPMSEEEFALEYGSLSYELTLYGPPPGRSPYNSLGEPVRQRLSEPVLVSVPGKPPNLKMCIGYDEDEDNVQVAPPVAQPEIERNPNVDARMVEKTIRELNRELNGYSAQRGNNCDARMHEAPSRDAARMRELETRLREREAERSRQREAEAREHDAQARAREDREREKYEIERAARDRTLLDAIDALMALRRKT